MESEPLRRAVLCPFRRVVSKGGSKEASATPDGVEGAERSNLSASNVSTVRRSGEAGDALMPVGVDGLGGDFYPILCGATFPEVCRAPVPVCSAPF